MDFTRQRTLALCLLAAVSAVALVDTASAESWHGLTVAPEQRCSPYDKGAKQRFFGHLLTSMKCTSLIRREHPAHRRRQPTLSTMY